LRQVLNDSVESPGYIETVPKRGYRFIALVSKQAAAVPPLANGPSEPIQSGKFEASIAYLKGHYLTKRHTPANSARALEYYEEAIRLDPDYSLPYHGAALIFILNALVGATPPLKSLADAERFLARGLALDPDSAMVQNTLAMLRMFQMAMARSGDRLSARHRVGTGQPPSAHDVRAPLQFLGPP
jgi:hypothetical protein